MWYFSKEARIKRLEDKNELLDIALEILVKTERTLMFSQRSKIISISQKMKRNELKIRELECR